MACYRPQIAQQRSNGRVGFHDRPDDVGALRLPCGHCVGCQLDRAVSWSLRCQHEASLWDRNCFVTLTYDDEHVPKRYDNRSLYRSVYQSAEPQGFVGETLRYRDVQLFLKKLRKRCAGDLPDANGRFPIRFLAAGEYGGRTGRPHYHLLLFNWSPDDAKSIGKNLSESEVLSDLWRNGFASVGSLTPASASYVAQYSLKKVYGPIESEQRYKGIEPEFVVMSRRPGIGSWWYDKFSSDVFPADFVVESGGRKHKVPRYYQERFKAERPDEFAEILESRERDSLNRPRDTRSFERLAVAEEVARARLETFNSREAV